MFDFRYPTPLPSTKGWGPGYPDCRPDKMVADSLFAPSMHRRVKELSDRLNDEMRSRGFKFDDPGCWGYGCRGTKTSSGGSKAVPSFHSWGLARDVNAPHNVYGAARANTQLGQPEYAWVVKLHHDYGWFWLGPAIGDWMHFSFCGSPADADKMRRKARRNGLGEPEPVFKVGTRTFRVMRNAVDYLRDKLRHSKVGDALTVRVRRA